MKYWIVQDAEDEDEDEEKVRYSNLLSEEEYEDDDPPEAFGGLQKGSEIDGGGDDRQEGPIPWDPSDIFFRLI
jgi:hypothetical protein